MNRIGGVSSSASVLHWASQHGYCCHRVACVPVRTGQLPTYNTPVPSATTKCIPGPTLGLPPPPPAPPAPGAMGSAALRPRMAAAAAAAISRRRASSASPAPAPTPTPAPVPRPPGPSTASTPSDSYPLLLLLLLPPQLRSRIGTTLLPAPPPSPHASSCFRRGDGGVCPRPTPAPAPGPAPLCGGPPAVACAEALRCCAAADGDVELSTGCPGRWRAAPYGAVLPLSGTLGADSTRRGCWWPGGSRVGDAARVVREVSEASEATDSGSESDEGDGDEGREAAAAPRATDAPLPLPSVWVEGQQKQKAMVIKAPVGKKAHMEWAFGAKWLGCRRMGGKHVPLLREPRPV